MRVAFDLRNGFQPWVPLNILSWRENHASELVTSKSERPVYIYITENN